MSVDGGWLDLDSNPACSMDHVNNENVFWPPGQAPVGEFIVRVDFYEDCCSCGANYTVTVNYCGLTEVFEEKFLPDTDDGGSAGSGVTITTFSNEKCQTVLRGKVMMEDGEFKGDVKDGKILKRKIAEAIRNRPAL